jgi:hypothetical protein
MQQTDVRHIAAILTAALVTSSGTKDPRDAVKIFFKCLDAMKDEAHKRSNTKNGSRG